MPQLKIKKLNFAIPLMAIAGLGAIGGWIVGADSEYDASATNAEPVTAAVSYGDYYLSLSTGSEINLNIEATATGVYSYATDDVVVATNAPGYDLSISSSDSATAGLKLNGTETTTNKIINTSSATGGTTGTTAVLAANTYGYAVPSGMIGNDNFDSSYDNPTASSKWAGVPVAGSSTYGKIRSTTAATSDTGDEIDVHYGVYANNALVAGDYTGTVVYTAVANAPAEMTASISPTSGYAGSTVTVTSGPLVANTAMLANSDVSITIGGSACTVTNVDTSNGYLVTTCTVPSGLSAGAKNVAISVSRYNYSTTISNGFTVNEPPYTIHYNGNSATYGAMSDQTTIDGTSDGFSTNISSSNANAVTLRAPNFYRTNYGFAGWTTNSNGTGTVYGPMETVDITSLVNSNNEMTLYAKWVSSAGNIQSWSGCSSLSTGSVTALKDTRDGNTYAVAKLGDGKCWMIENLRLGGASAISITSSNSVTAGSVTASTNSFGTGATTQQMNYSNINTSLTASPNNSGSWYGYGNYYSWAQAIMSTTSYETRYEKVTTSLCPKGWHLPTGRTASSDTTSNNEFYGVNYYANGSSSVTSSSAALRKYPYNFVYSGRWDGSSAYYRGTYGCYWSSTVYLSNDAYLLYFNATYVLPGTGIDGKYYGRSVRCVAG